MTDVSTQRMASFPISIAMLRLGGRYYVIARLHMASGLNESQRVLKARYILSYLHIKAYMLTQD